MKQLDVGAPPGVETSLELIGRTVAEFFQTHFHESARLIRCESVGKTIHVNGYRPLAPAELHAAVVPDQMLQLQKYHDELLRTTRFALQEKLSAALHAPISSLECRFDLADHHFEIIIVQ